MDDRIIQVLAGATGIMIAVVGFQKLPGLQIATEAQLLLAVGVIFLLIMQFGMLSVLIDLKLAIAQQSAPTNGGPATPVDDSGIMEGPLSVI